MVDYTDPRWNEADSQNTSPSPNGIPPGSAPSAVPAVLKAHAGAAKRSFDRENARGLCTNSGNAYALTYDVPPDEYENGEFFSFFVPATNTGAATLAINGMSAKDLVQNDGTALKAGDLVAGMVVTATYNGSKFRMVTASANPSFGAIAATTVAATTGMTINSLPVFTTANDGAGSGLDSDKLDGQEGSWYQSRANHTGTQDVATITGLQAVLDAIVPASSVIYVASATAPTGYLAANGTAVSRTTYARLFTAIGTTFGAGDGSTTFNLPDLRGEFIRGLDSGRNVDAGRALGSVQGSQNLAHAHGVSDPGHAHGVYDPGHSHYTTFGSIGTSTGPGAGGADITGPNYGPNNNYGSSASGTGIGIYGAATGIAIQSNGGTEARPRNIALLACIKT